MSVPPGYTGSIQISSLPVLRAAVEHVHFPINSISCVPCTSWRNKVNKTVTNKQDKVNF